MGSFSHLLNNPVTPVTRAPTPRVTGLHQQNQPSNTGYTGYTDEVSNFDPTGENQGNAERKLRERNSGASRDLYLSGVTGVTSVTALKTNGNPGYTGHRDGCNQCNRQPRMEDIANALDSGTPEAIHAIVKSCPDLEERAAIREYDGGMHRSEAEAAALRDVLAEFDHDC